MDSKKTAVKRKRTKIKTIPDDLVFEILIRLPVKSLVRFKTVSKAWLAIISDPVFVRAHLGCSKRRQLQSPSSFLITPQVLLEPEAAEEEYHTKALSTNIHFYQWHLKDFDSSSSSTATLICKRHFPDGEFGPVSLISHCDGLVLLPTSTKAYVFNPAMGHAITLPESQRNMLLDGMCLPVGFGFDACTGRYKVARSFYRSRHYKPLEIISMGMEVFTITGGGEHDSGSSWRETLVDPPYPILSAQTGTHCKGYLFFFINKSNQEQEQPPNGLLRFSLQDETFGVTLVPSNVELTVDDEDIRAMELDGELCFSYLSKSSERLVIWMTRDIVDPHWDCRYVTDFPQLCYPMASLGIGGILLRRGNFIFHYDFEVNGVREDEIFDLGKDLRYLGPSEGALEHSWKNVSWFDIICYSESLVPITGPMTIQV